MYKIGQKKLAAGTAGVEIDPSAAVFQANAPYYLKLNSALPDGAKIYLYNTRDNNNPDEASWQELKADFNDPTIYVFVPLLNYEHITEFDGTLYQLTNQLDGIIAERIGLQARPTSLFVINGELFRVGYNGILEVDNEVKVISISRIAGNDYAILDYMYKED